MFHKVVPYRTRLLILPIRNNHILLGRSLAGEIVGRRTGAEIDLVYPHTVTSSIIAACRHQLGIVPAEPVLSGRLDYVESDGRVSRMEFFTVGNYEGSVTNSSYVGDLRWFHKSQLLNEGIPLDNQRVIDAILGGNKLHMVLQRLRLDGNQMTTSVALSA